jgi:hypothetical protein
MNKYILPNGSELFENDLQSQADQEGITLQELINELGAEMMEGSFDQLEEVEIKQEEIKPKKTKEEGFNLFTEFTDSFNAITQGGKVGLTMAETTDEFSQIMRSGGESNKEEIQNAFEAIQKINNAPPIEAMEEWNQAYDRYIEKGDNAIQATYKATTEAGTDGFLGFMAQSVTSLFNLKKLLQQGQQEQQEVPL